MHAAFARQYRNHIVSRLVALEASLFREQQNPSTRWSKIDGRVLIGAAGFVILISVADKTCVSKQLRWLRRRQDEGNRSLVALFSAARKLERSTRDTHVQSDLKALLSEADLVRLNQCQALGMVWTCKNRPRALCVEMTCTACHLACIGSLASAPWSPIHSSLGPCVSTTRIIKGFNSESMTRNAGMLLAAPWSLDRRNRFSS